MQITLFQRVIFSISGRYINSERGDPLIQEFKIALKGLKVNEPPVSASVFLVDGFEIRQLNQNLYEGRYLVRWEVLDRETGWETRMNHATKALLIRTILAISINECGEPWAIKIQAIKVLDGSY